MPTTIGGATPVPPTNDPALKWAHFAGDPKNLNGTTVSASPVLDNGVLYFGTQDGRLYALRAADRTLLWQYPQPSAPPLAPIWRSAAVASGAVFFCSQDTGLFAVSTSNGAKLWEIGPDQNITEVSVTSQPVLANGLLYINDIGGGFGGPAFVAVGDLKGHTIMSLNPTESDVFGVSAPLVAGGRVYVGGNDGYFYALDAAKPGPELWRAETGAAKDQQLKQPNSYFVTAMPAIVDGVIYVGSWDSSVYALDATTGARLWSFPTTDQITYSSPVVVNGMLYVGSNDKTLYALDPHTGKLVWSYATGGRIDGTPTIVDGVVYIGAYDQYVHAVDATTGQLIRKYRTGANVYAQTIVADGVLYALTTKGWMLAFRLS